MAETTETTEAKAPAPPRRVALVTGASRGIGRAIAQALARDGLFVVLNYRSNTEAAQEALELCGEGNGQLLPFDVSNPAQVDQAITQLTAQHGRLDVLVNNAGVAIDGLLLRMKNDDWGQSLAQNLSSAFYLCRAAAKWLLRAKEGGRIINLTSVVGEIGSAGQIGYVSAKAGLIGLTKTLARELAGRGVTANAVAPGFIETDMTREHVKDDARQKLIQQIPLGRIGSPEDVAAVVAFLASEQAGYITGQVLRVNGGLHCG